MGYLNRYRQQAHEIGLPRANDFAICEIASTGAAILIFRRPNGYHKDGHFVVTYNEFPELPMEFPTYDKAFTWLVDRLTPREK